MKLSQSLFVTMREDPKEAEVISHKLLLRAGYIRRVGSGVHVTSPNVEGSAEGYAGY